MCAPATAAGPWISPGVREKRGAGAGWLNPFSSTIVPLATMCGWLLASLIGSTGAKHTSVPSRISHHSSRVLVRKSSVNRLCCSGHASRSVRFAKSAGSKPTRWRNSAKNWSSIAPRLIHLPSLVAYVS